MVVRAGWDLQGPRSLQGIPGSQEIQASRSGDGRRVGVLGNTGLPEDILTLSSLLDGAGFDPVSFPLVAKAPDSTPGTTVNVPPPAKVNTVLKETKEQSKPETDAPAGFKQRLHRAAVKAQATFDHMKGKCFKTANLIVRWLSGHGIDNYKASESSIGQPIGHLNKLIEIGKLKPGMVIYVSKRPGADENSVIMAYGPHWFTFLGKDEKGIPRFVDQYSTQQTVQSLTNMLPGRKIYQVIDPFPKTR